MKPERWRVAALVLILAGTAFACYQMTLPMRDDFGVLFTVPRNAPGTVQVTSVAPGSPAAKAGIRPGDSLQYGDTAVQRARVIYATPGSRVTVIVNRSHAVTMIVRSIPADGMLWALLALRLAFLSVAALLAWRRPGDAASRALVAFLWCYGLAIAMNNVLLPNPLASLAVLQMGTGVLFLLGTAAAAAFAANFPSGRPRPVPRSLSRAAQLLAALAICALALAEWLPRSAGGVSLLNAAFLFLFAFIGVLLVATLTIAYVQGQPAERQRRRWVFLILGAALGALVVDILVQSIFGFRQWIDQLALIPLIALPIGLAYVILRHRVLDVGFVLNRAAVYASLSIVIVGIFVVVETLLAKFVEAHSHVGSMAVRLATALALGFSIRFIHARVDRFVDTVFFRERHKAEAAMREFTQDAPYVTDGDVLLRRCVEMVLRYAGAANAAIWLRQDDGSYAQTEGTFAAGSVDENDPAILAMRSRRVIVDLPAAASSLPGMYAFPMIARGRLAGVLLCGPKRADELYAPDERELLADLATAVAHTLDALRVADLERTVERLLAGGSATRGAMGTF